MMPAKSVHRTYGRQNLAHAVFEFYRYHGVELKNIQAYCDIVPLTKVLLSGFCCPYVLWFFSASDFFDIE